MSKIEVSNIWAEDLFKWFYDHVQDSGGDGAGAIVCDNYKEVADWFTEWWRKEIKPNFRYAVENNLDFWHKKDEYDNIVNFHDNNENYIFTCDYIDLGVSDYVFLVVGDCQFAFEPPNSNKIIKKYI